MQGLELLRRAGAMIVSDRPSVRATVRAGLAPHRVWRILDCETALKAFAQLAVQRPGVIFADADMRPPCGLTLVKEVRRSPIANRRTPIVLVHDAPTDADREAALSAGAQAALSAACPAEALEAALTAAAAVLEDRRAPRTLPYTGVERRRAAPADPAADQLANQLLDEIDRAMAAVRAWGAGQDEGALTTARAAAEAGAALAAPLHDTDVNRGFRAALNMIALAERSWDADPLEIEAALGATRAIVAAARHQDPMRGALIEALGELVSRRQMRV